MKYVLIRGAKDDGKSTTIDSVCKQLKPSRIQRLNINEENLEIVDNTIDIQNGTFIIEVNGKIILVVAGTPTEQKITITVIIEIVIKLKIKIDYAIVAIRSFEKKDGFDTGNELAKYGDCILEERIYRIDDDKNHDDENWFKDTEVWNKRIFKIVSCLYNELKDHSVIHTSDILTTSEVPEIIGRMAKILIGDSD